MRPARLRHVALTACALLCACNDTRDLAPPSADSPAHLPSSEEVAPIPAPVAAPAPAAKTPRQFTVPPDTAIPLPPPADVDSRHAYSLVELIDIAQRRNPATRVAWEQARQAAISVGIASATYLPELTASAIAGYEHVVFPFPSNLVPNGFISSNVQEAIPQLTVKYLLLDFGGRAASVKEANQLSIAANAAFTATHQQLIFNVARTYFTADGADAAVGAARQALSDAQLLQHSAEVMSGRGLATVVNVELARRGTAQARLDLTQATAAQQEAKYMLLEAMDLPPTTKLHLATASDRPLPPRTARTVEQMLQDALQRRPDLLAGVAKLRASDAKIAEARSALNPRISLGANAQGNFSQMNVDGGPYLGVHRPQGALLLKLEWPLYDGGLLQNKLNLARSQHEQEADALQGRTDQALREVAFAYDQIETGLQQYEAALALQTASEAAFRAAGESYARGVGTFTDAVTAQTGLASARAVVARAHAQALINGSALAFATGLLTSSAEFETAAHR
jgi:outer membrane protein